MLPKKGDKFNAVVQHLTSTPFMELAMQYTDLRIKVVDHQLNTFNAITANWGPVPDFRYPLVMRDYNSRAPASVSVEPFTNGYPFDLMWFWPYTY